MKKVMCGVIFENNEYSPIYAACERATFSTPMLLWETIAPSLALRLTLLKRLISRTLWLNMRLVLMAIASVSSVTLMR